MGYAIEDWSIPDIEDKVYRFMAEKAAESPSRLVSGCSTALPMRLQTDIAGQDET